MVTSKPTCPKCDQSLPENSPAGLCPACLMIAGVGSTAEQLFDLEAGPDEEIGAQIGRYKVLEKIGEGGFGVVYMAEQTEPVRRRVALKVIKPGMDSKQIIARFEAERQALAMMDHENIARVLDAGTSESGRPYFVMELVRGLPITTFCDRGKLPPRKRLELMIDVCRAIQHAHQKGIIHRDIKPSNVLVTLYDGRPVPKVIDFGVAKAIQQPLTDKTMFTRFGQVMGTLEYMSPEQAEMSGLDIDTRGDIYSLGVLMYELLAGSTPLSRDRLRSAAIDEVLRLIRDEEPERPSLRLDKSTEQKQTISSLRGMAPEKLESVLRGELDWIVMRAIEKDRTRRYDNAKDFAADIQRFLDDEPVVAAPPSRIYRIRKFVWKHRTAAGLVTAALLMLVIGMATIFSMYTEARTARMMADDALTLAEHARHIELQLTEELKKETEEMTVTLTELDSEREAKTDALNRNEVALRQSNALRLAAESALTRHSNPGLSLRLAHEALKLEPDSSQANASFISALQHCRELKTILFDEEIDDVVFGKHAKIATISTGQRIEVWDLRNARIQATIDVPVKLNFEKFVLSPDGSKLILLSLGWQSFVEHDDGRKFVLTDRAARVFDTVGGNEIVCLRGHTDKISDAVFSDDGTRIVTGSWDGTAKIWDADTGQLEATLVYDEGREATDQQQDVSSRHADKSQWTSISNIGFTSEGEVKLTPFSGQKTSPLDYEFLGNKVLENKLKILEAFSVDIADLMKPDVVDPDLQTIDASVRRTGGGISSDFEASEKQLPQLIFSNRAGGWERASEIVEDSGNDSVDLDLTDAKLIALKSGKNILLERDGQVIDELKGHQHEVLTFEFDTQREHLVSADKNSIRIWRTKPIVGEIELSQLPNVTCVAQDRNAKYLATGHADGTARIWRTVDRKCVIVLQRDYKFISDQHRAELWPQILHIEFSPDGGRLLTHSGDIAVLRNIEDGEKARAKIMPTDVVRVWDWKRQELLNSWQRRDQKSFDAPRFFNYHDARFSENGENVIVVDSAEHACSILSATGQLLDKESGDRFPMLDKDNQICGPYLGLRSWNIDTGKTEFEVFSDQILEQPYFVNSGRFAIVSASEKRLLIDTVKVGQPIAELPYEPAGNCGAAIISKSGDLVFAGMNRVGKNNGKCGFLVDLSDASQIETVTLPAELLEQFSDQTITDYGWSPNGETIAMSLESGWILQFDIKRSEFRKFQAHSQSIHRVKYTGDGRYFVTASEDTMCRVWNSNKNELFMEFGPHESGILDFLIHPIGDVVFVFPNSSNCRIWPLNPSSALLNLDSVFPTEIPRQLTEEERDKYRIKLLDEKKEQ